MTYYESMEQKAVEQNIPKLYWECKAWNCKTQRVMNTYVEISPIEGVVTPEMVTKAKKEFFRKNFDLIRMDLFKSVPYLPKEIKTKLCNN